MSVFSSIAVTNSFHFREIDLSLYFIEYNEYDRKTAKKQRRVGTETRDDRKT